jgi:protein SCO1
MRPRVRLVLLAGTTLLVVAFALAVTLHRPSPRSPSGVSTSVSTSPHSPSGFDGAVLPPHVRARELTLTYLSPSAVPSSSAGRRATPSRSRRSTVSLSAYRGRVVVLAGLYTTCGPTCTLIAQQIRGALDDLPRPVPVLIVSADPAADTPARVRRFLARVSLSGRVHYLTGPLSRLRPVWHAYGIVPARTGRAAFDASASVLLIDPHGYERIIFGVEQLTPDALAHDIRRLQSGA